MYIRMQLFAFAGKCGGLGASGFCAEASAAMPSSGAMAARASEPIPFQHCASHWRRPKFLSDIYELIGVEQNPAQPAQLASGFQIILRFSQLVGRRSAGQRQLEGETNLIRRIRASLLENPLGKVLRLFR